MSDIKAFLNSGGTIRRLVGLLSCLIVVGLLAGCASTGRGEFPALEETGLSDKDLAVLPTVGAVSSELQSSILYHFDREGFEQRFGSVSFISPRDARMMLGDNFTLDQLARSEPINFGNLTDADLILGLQVNEFAVQEFTTTETRTLYRSNTSFENTSVVTSSSGDDNGRGPGKGPGKRKGPPDDDGEERNTIITSTETNTTRREIPVTRGNIRVVLSLTAVLYDTEQSQVIWRGQRIERAQDELNDLSSIELKDIVVERVMYRINSRLAE